MIDSQRLLQESKKLLKVLEKDIRERLDELPNLDGQLKSEWEAARSAKRTAGAYLEWREENITQSAVHWILGCVFLRFLEDNDFLARVYLTSAEKDAREAGRDDYERYFRTNPNHSDLEYLLHAFREVSRLPGLKGLYDEQHNPLFRLPLSGDGGMALLGFWRKVDADSGLLVHDFSDPNRETRFLGDLYQDLSESAKERYALLQTPEFVEEFILDRTLTPAIDTFGYKGVRLIDPTCGSGHFLLGAFCRLFNLWAKHEPARNLPDLAQRALDSVYGVDINPFAVEIARFRLLIAALSASDIRKLKDAPDFKINLAIGDSLLHGPRFGLRGTAGMFENKEDYASTGLSHAYQTEDMGGLERVLGQQYQVVVGNPPYITPKDTALRAAYRDRYISCHMKYSLGAPFTERFIDLAVNPEDSARGGFVGMITANSFMKREFGKKLIEEFLPNVDLTHVIDTSGAYIPGHGTPTVILMARHRAPVSELVRAVMGISGETAPPVDPANGPVWRSIVESIDVAGRTTPYVSVIDLPRLGLKSHPWKLQGGGVPSVLSRIDDCEVRLRELTESIGFMAIAGEDDAYTHTRIPAKGKPEKWRNYGIGEGVRDWSISCELKVSFPYQQSGAALTVDSDAIRDERLRYWSCRVSLRQRLMFGKTQEESGLHWAEYRFFVAERYLAPLKICFAFVSTHNHFVLVRDSFVFKQSAPVMMLSPGSDEEQHLELAGLLNSSAACFWMRQNSFGKGGDHVGTKGARVVKTQWEERFEFTGTRLQEFPIPATRPTVLSQRLDQDARARQSLLSEWKLSLPLHRADLDDLRRRSEQLLMQMIGNQEELDWWSYGAYGLAEQDLTYSGMIPGLALGQRAFEIVLARRLANGTDATTWFERHGSTPITELPTYWPADYRALVEQRIALIESDRSVGLIERPEYKRRWNTESWDEQEKRALRDWLLDRLETERYWPRAGSVQPRSVFQLSDAVRGDIDFMHVAALYTDRDDFDVSSLITELTEAESVPFLSALRCTDEGLRKRAEWEEAWTLQRKEDAIAEKVAAANPRKDEESEGEYRKRIELLQRDARLKAVGDVPVPPKYKSSDFRNGTYWRLRGALDVPKERFISYPTATPDADGTLLLGWAGWDHLQQATALAGHYLHLKENEGWPVERLIPLLAGLLELVPWLKQWHNEWNPEHDARMGDYFEGFVQDEAKAMGVTAEALSDWRPVSKPAKRSRRTKNSA